MCHLRVLGICIALLQVLKVHQCVFCMVYCESVVFWQSNAGSECGSAKTDTALLQHCREQVDDPFILFGSCPIYLVQYSWIIQSQYSFHFRPIVANATCGDGVIDKEHYCRLTLQVFWKHSVITLQNVRKNPQISTFWWTFVECARKEMFQAGWWRLLQSLAAKSEPEHQGWTGRTPTLASNSSQVQIVWYILKGHKIWLFFSHMISQNDKMTYSLVWKWDKKKGGEKSIRKSRDHPHRFPQSPGHSTI